MMIKQEFDQARGVRLTLEQATYVIQQAHVKQVPFSQEVRRLVGLGIEADKGMSCNDAAFDGPFYTVADAKDIKEEGE